jgi:hypothetical protein
MTALVSAWWIVGLGITGAVVVGAILWRLALADLVFAVFDLP